MTRRTVLAMAAGALQRSRVQTVRGPVAPKELGTTLIHEHVMVDFIGADEVSPSRYNPDEVFRTALPKLNEVKSRGCRTLVECTPAYLGRDPRLLRRLSEATGVHIITNTGLYGANKDRHVPKFAYTEPADELARRWTAEYEQGIEGTGIKPGFMKIGVDAGRLSEIDAKLVHAGCICHGQTGLRMHIHTGDGVAAMEILDIMAKRGTPAGAYVWVHAQNEKDRALHIRAAKAGVWLEFEDRDLAAVPDLVQAGYLRQILISQDSGWYRVGEPGGGQFNGYTSLFDTFRSLSPAQMRQLLVDNPARVLTWA